MAQKKYYWLKLQKDFFKRHDIRIIESMPNGKDYILFYLKLLVESIDHEGELRFSETIPYNDEMLSTITDTNIDIVRSALKIFTELNMIELMDDHTIYMAECSKMIGSASQDDHQLENHRERQRRYREHQKVIETSQKRHDDIIRDVEIEKEIEKEIEIDIEKEIEIEADQRSCIDYQKIIASYNSICRSYPQVKSLSDARKKAIRARLNTYSEADLIKVFEMAEASDFLKGKNDRGWIASFDWMLKDSNMAKILDGNYTNRTASQSSGNGSLYEKYFGGENG